MRKAQLRGMAAGVTVLGFFALMWTGWGSGQILRPTAEASLMTVAAGLSVFLAVMAWRYAKQAPDDQPDPEAAVQGRAVGKRFGYVVAAEFVGIGLVSGILGATGHPNLIPSLVAVGVGIHFFPLANLFAQPTYRWTGALMCALVVATLIIAPLSGVESLWAVIPGIGSALVLYGTCLVQVSRIRAQLRMSLPGTPANSPAPARNG
jgi:hypothetical protein